MKNKYTVNNIFNNNEISFTDLITKIFTSFLDENFALVESNNTNNENTIQAYIRK